MFNEAPNNSLEKRYASNNNNYSLIQYVRLTTCPEYQGKAELQKTNVNATIIRKVRADENKLCTGKEWRP